jgi:hypothetical protein
MSINLPVPRIPALPTMPSPDLMDELLAGSGDRVRAARAAQAETRAAVDELVSGRPGGAGWVEARTADQAAVLAGKPATRVAALLAGDPARYGTALALCSTLAQRGRVEPPAGLGDAARQAALALHEPMRTVTLALSRALVEKRLSDAHKAREQGVVVAAALAERQAVARWCEGEPFAVRAGELPEMIAEGWLDAVDELDGVPADRSWRQRRAEQRNIAVFHAQVQQAAGVY